MTTAIWWIRRDLRLTDNQALDAAMAGADHVLPLFVLDPALLDSDFAGEKRIAFLLGGLHALDAALRARNSSLIVRRGDPAEELGRLCRQQDVAAVFAEEDLSPYARRRDRKVARELGHIPLSLVPGVTIRPPGSVTKNDGSIYTVFTPYSKRWKHAGAIQTSQIIHAPPAIPTPHGIDSLPIPRTPVLPECVPFPPGEAEGKARLGRFTEGENAPVYRYAGERDRPDNDMTSRLSPYLRFGMISPRLAAFGAYQAISLAPNQQARQGAEIWLDELIWRDFYQTILWQYPHVRGGNFRPEYDAILWNNNSDEFAAWCEGSTGYPFVDAAMRQLKRSGWMHNRARMVVASYLVKDLLIDWRWGERWFMQQLVDGDPAANNGGWQWSAGTGTDAAPYFRIFNPVSQGMKFDPEGTYVRRWVPELAEIPTKHIHTPWKLSPAEQVRFRCRIGVDYPRPMVDHAWARQRTLEAYRAARG